MNRRLGSLLLLAVLAAIAPGCSGAGGDDDDDCLLDSPVRGLLEDEVGQLVFEAGYVAEHSAPFERAFGVHLVGVQEAFSGSATAISACTAQTSYAPYCEALEDPSLSSLNECLRLGCQSARVTLTDAYFTADPHVDPDDRHAFDYPTTSPAGTASYIENPLITWEAIVTGTSGADVSASIAHTVTIDPDDGGPIVFDHTGLVLGSRSGNETSLSIALSFPSLVVNEKIEVDLGVDTAGGVAGSISLDEGPGLAGIGSSGVTWACE